MESALNSHHLIVQFSIGYSSKVCKIVSNVKKSSSNFTKKTFGQKTVMYALKKINWQIKTVANCPNIWPKRHIWTILQ